MVGKEEKDRALAEGWYQVRELYKFVDVFPNSYKGIATTTPFKSNAGTLVAHQKYVSAIRLKAQSNISLLAAYILWKHVEKSNN